jgi:CelD/BcsL family acetyltransferase involved in cellulose biosynthesis
LLTAHVLNSVDEVVGMAESWNQLWDRSRTTLPTSRAEFLGPWREQFAPEAEFRAVIVEDGANCVAALPIVGHRWAKVVRSGVLPRNDWLLAGNLLVDETADTRRALQVLAETLNQLPWTVFRFSHVPSHETSWQSFREALLGAGLQIESRPSFQVVRIPIDSDWDSYQRSWSKNHRKNMSRTLRRLEEQGGGYVRRTVPTQSIELREPLQTAFVLEDSGWKGASASSIVQTPNMPQFVTQICERLTARKEIEIAILELDGRPLAFEILWNSRGTLHSYKVGYDERFSKLNPGQCLMHELLRDLFESRRCEYYDCFGPISTATEKWRGERYEMSQWTVAPRRLLSRAVLKAYQQWCSATTPPHDNRVNVLEAANGSEQEESSLPLSSTTS